VPVISEFSVIGFSALSGYIQLLPRLIILISLYGIHDSNKLMFIFRFSNINSVPRVLFACIPPTFAAALIIIFGFTLSISFVVSFNENKLASCLVDFMTS
jgi:hypothetical protein